LGICQKVILKLNNLPRSSIIKKRREIVALLSAGRRFDGSCIRLILPHTPGNFPRAAFLVNKKLGRKANVRVKIKRWLRELYRNNKNLLPRTDMVLSVRVQYRDLKYQDLYNDFHTLISSKEFIDFWHQIIPEAAVAPQNQ